MSDTTALITQFKPTSIDDGFGVQFGRPGQETSLWYKGSHRGGSVLSYDEEKAIDRILREHVEAQGPWFKKNYKLLSPKKGSTRNATGTMGSKAIRAQKKARNMKVGGNVVGYSLGISLKRIEKVGVNKLSYSESNYPFYYESGTKGPIFPKHNMFEGPVEWTGRPARGNVLVLRNKMTNKKTGSMPSVAGQAAHTPFARTAQSAPRNFNDIIARNRLRATIQAVIAATP